MSVFSILYIIYIYKGGMPQSFEYFFKTAAYRYTKRLYLTATVVVVTKKPYHNYNSNNNPDYIVPGENSAVIIVAT